MSRFILNDPLDRPQPRDPRRLPYRPDYGSAKKRRRKRDAVCWAIVIFAFGYVALHVIHFALGWSR